MSNLSNKLKFSVSLAALMSAGGMVSNSARGSVSVTGTQPFIAITTNVVGDVHVHGEGLVSPGGMSIVADVSNDIENNGRLEGMAALANSGPTDVTTTVTGLYMDGNLGNDLINVGSIVGSVAITNDVDITLTSGDANTTLSYDLDGDAFGVKIEGDIAGDVHNIGAISASVSLDDAIDVDVNATTDSGFMYVYPDLEATAVGFDHDGTIAGNFVNDGLIEASATINVVENLAANGTTYAYSSLYNYSPSASAEGINLGTLTGDFVNTGSVVANAAITLDANVRLSATGNTATASNYISDFMFATAEPLSGTINGAFDNQGTIAGTASVAFDYDVQSQVPAGDYAEAYFYFVTASAYATAVSIYGSHSFDNSLDILADASSSGVIRGYATAPVGSAYAYNSGSYEAYAKGAYDGGTVSSWDNTGSIAATADATIVVDLAANGGTNAYVYNDIYHYAYASGAYIRTLEGDLNNSGSITAVANANATVNGAALNVGSTGGPTAYLSVSDSISASAIGLDIGHVSNAPTITNSGTISAEANSIAVYDLQAKATDGGTFAGMTIDFTNLATATGIDIDSKGDYHVANSGTVSAAATVLMDLDVAVTADAGSATLYLSDAGYYAYAYGIDDDALSFSNSETGVISATAAVGVDELIAVNGATGVYVVLYNAYSGYASAEAVDIGDLDGAFTNAGIIAADASVDYVVAVDAINQGSASGPYAEIYVSDFMYAFAYGVEIDQADEGNVITNTGTISANAIVTADYDVAAQALGGGTWASASIYYISMSASARGIDIDGSALSINNSGMISADAVVDAAINVMVTADAGSASASLDHINFYADARGLQDDTTDFDNSGTIAADASINAVETVVVNAATGSYAYLAADNYANATASGAYVGSLAGDFDNTGSITATANSVLSKDYSAVHSGTAGYADVYFEDDAYAFAYAAEIGTANGAITNGPDASIAADAQASIANVINVDGPSAYLTANGISAYVSAYGLAVWNSGQYSIDNSGSISTNSSVSSVLDATVNAAAATGYVSLDDVSAWNSAYGVYGNGEVTGFDNSGAITATANALIDSSVLLTGVTAASSSSIDYSGDQSAGGSAYGVYLSALTGDFDNSGTITADSTATLVNDVTVQNVGASADVYIYENEVYALGYGVDLRSFNGSFSNTSANTISGSGAATMNINVLAEGPSASIDIRDMSASASGLGVYIHSSGTSDFTNSGTISASSMSDVTVALTANADVGQAYIDLGHDLDANAWAWGVYISNSSTTGFDNSGDITADAVATVNIDAVANGAVSGTISGSPSASATVTGVHIRRLDANFTNSGTISGSASATLNANYTADSTVSLNNTLYVRAIGAELSFDTPVPTGSATSTPEATFNNAGDITAVGNMVLNQAIIGPATPTVTGSSNMEVVGALLDGNLGSATNSGTISGVGTVQAPNGFAEVGGLVIEGIDEDFVVNNSGTLSADLDGVAGSSYVAAFYVSGSGSSSYEGPGPAPTATLTVNNTGTITASNTTGAGPANGVDLGDLVNFNTTVNQLGGHIDAPTAIQMDQGEDDIVNWSGGEISGLVDADSGDVVNVFQGASSVLDGMDFSLEGASALNINGVASTTPVMLMLGGFVTNTGTLNVNPLGNLYVDDAATVVVGNYNQDDTGTLTIDINGSNAGQITSVGDAALDGTIAVAPKADLYSDESVYTVVQATGTSALVNGTFDELIGNNQLLLNHGVTYTDTTADLTVTRNAFGSVAGLTTNGQSVADGIEDGYDPEAAGSGNSPQYNSVLSSLFVQTDANLYGSVLGTWSGSQHAQVMGAALGLSAPYNMAISEHLNDTRHGGAESNTVALRNSQEGDVNAPGYNAAAGQSGSEKKGTFWGRAIGRFTSRDGDANATGYDETIAGIVLGVDYQVSENAKLGIAGMYLKDDIDFDNNSADDADIKRFTIGGYGSYAKDALHIDASFSYAHDKYDVTRTLVYGDAACLSMDCMAQASAEYTGDLFQAYGEVGYQVEMGNGGSIEPFVGLSYVHLKTDSFEETGAGDLGLSVDEASNTSLQSTLGARMTFDMSSSGGTRFVPELRAEWRHEFENDPLSFNASLIGDSNASFTTIGSEMKGDWAVIGAGITAVFGDSGTSAYLDYQAEFGSGGNGHTIMGGARIKF